MVTTRERLASIWPQFGLEIRTRRLELRMGDDDDLVDLAELAERGVHDPSVMPFTGAWTDAEPPGRARGGLAFHWQARGDCCPEKWHLPLVVLADGEVIGLQALMATSFPVLREVSSGSWLGLSHQGKGYGKEMRAAVLHLAFDGLGARSARSAAFLDNPASAGVSRALGYREDGTEAHVVRGDTQVATRFLLTSDEWNPRLADGFELIGLDRLHPLLGA